MPKLFRFVFRRSSPAPCSLGGGFVFRLILHAQRSAFILLFAVACASAPLAPSATPAPPTSASDNPTAGAARRLTQQAATAVAASLTQRAAATQTALAAARVTAAAQTQAAVQAAATGQAVQSAKGVWPQRLVESFADNHLGWPLGLTADHSLSVTSSIDASRYRWLTHVANGNSYFNLAPSQAPVFTDLYAQVTLRFVSGNDDGESAYGLVFRLLKNDYGFFGVLKSGRIRILEVHDSGIYHLDESDLPAAAVVGAPLRLAVIAVGPDFDFLVNDQLVGQMNADLKPGQIGLGIDALAKAGEAQVDFSDFQVNAP